MKHKITWRNVCYGVENCYLTGNGRSRGTERFCCRSLARAGKFIITRLSATGMIADARKSVLRMWGFAQCDGQFLRESPLVRIMYIMLN